MRIIKYVFDRVFAALTWFALLLLGCMTAIIFADVFCRYVLHFSIAWADEISLILLVWYVFIALAIGVRRKVHVSIDLLGILFHSKALDRASHYFVTLLVFCFGGLLIYFGIALIQIGSFSTLASVDISSSVEYIFIPVSGALVMYSAALDFFRPRHAEPEADYLDTVFMNKVGRNV